MNNIETMKLALEALEFNVGEIGFTEVEKKALTSLRQAIKQAQQAEPVAWMRDDEMKAMVSDEKRAWILCGRSELIEDYNKPLYTSPPPRQPLTDEEIKQIWLNGKDHGDDWLDVQAIARAIEAAHGITKEKNT